MGTKPGNKLGTYKFLGADDEPDNCCGYACSINDLCASAYRHFRPQI